jgi:predicted Zn-dependent protease
MSTCPKGAAGCPQEHPGCIGHNRAGGPCGAQPMNGTEPKRCRSHLGRKPEIVKAEWDARRRGERIRAEYDLPAQSDPLQELLRLSREVIAWKDAMRVMVGELTEIRYKSGAGEQIRAEIKLYENAMDRAARVLSDILRLGVEERLVKVAAAQTKLVAGAIQAALTEVGPMLGYAPDEPEIRAVVAKHLRRCQTEDKATS